MLLKRSQSQSKAFLHGKDAFTLAYIIAQIPPLELNDLPTSLGGVLRHAVPLLKLTVKPLKTVEKM